MPQNKKSAPIRRRRPLLKRPLFVVFLIALLILVIFACIKFQPWRKLLPSHSSPSTSLEDKTTAKSSESSSSSKQSTLEKSPENGDASNPDGKTPAAYEGANANSSESLTGVITYASISGSNLLIRTNIDQYLTSGTCDLALINGSNQITVSTNIIPEASTSTCEGFDLPLSSLSSFSGETQIRITLSSGDRSGVLSGVVNL